MLDAWEFMNRRERRRWGDDDRVVRLPPNYDTASIVEIWPIGPRVRYPSPGPRVPPARNRAGARPSSP